MVIVPEIMLNPLRKSLNWWSRVTGIIQVNLSTLLILMFLTPLVQTKAQQAAAKTPSKKSMIYEVKSEITTIYLLGSVHFGSSDLYPLNPKIENAFKVSPYLVVEANVNSNANLGAMLELVSKGLYGPGDNIKKHLSEKSYQFLSEKLKEMQLPYGSFDSFKPWFLAMNVMALEMIKLGIKPEHGIDMYFLSKANKKTILELEGMEAQLKMLNSLSDSEQEAFLMGTLSDLEMLQQNMNELFKAWKEGDEKAMESFLLDFKEESQGGEIYKKFFTDRNKSMLTKIEGYLKRKDRFFVVVGAAHLVGEEGLVQMLRQKGYSVTQF